MGQYYVIVNKTKKEYLDPYKFDSNLKLMDIAHSKCLIPLAVLLRKSTQTGGGDFHEIISQPKKYTNVVDAVRNAMKAEGSTPMFESKLIGSWAGDQIAFVGDYDKSGFSEVWQDENDYKDISDEMLELLTKADEWPDQEN